MVNGSDSFIIEPVSPFIIEDWLTGLLRDKVIQERFGVAPYARGACTSKKNSSKNAIRGRLFILSIALETTTLDFEEALWAERSKLILNWGYSSNKVQAYLVLVLYLLVKLSLRVIFVVFIHSCVSWTLNHSHEIMENFYVKLKSGNFSMK